jgi:hypothetical protein
MGIILNINLNKEIEKHLSLFPESFKSIDIEEGMAIINCDSEKFAVQTKPGLVSYLSKFQFKSWRIKENVLTLVYDYPQYDKDSNPILRDRKT